MHCSILPVGAKTINEALHFHQPMECLMRNARIEKSVFKNRHVGSCAFCASVGRLENHHIVPVWVYALRRILSANLTTYEECRQFWEDAARKRVTIGECNDAKNMLLLCTPCHVQEDTRTFAEWRQYFEANHTNLFFGIRTATAMKAWLTERAKGIR